MTLKMYGFFVYFATGEPREEERSRFFQVFGFFLTAVQIINQKNFMYEITEIRKIHDKYVKNYISF